MLQGAERRGQDQVQPSLRPTRRWHERVSERNSPDPAPLCCQAKIPGSQGRRLPYLARVFAPHNVITQHQPPKGSVKAAAAFANFLPLISADSPWTLTRRACRTPPLHSQACCPFPLKGVFGKLSQESGTSGQRGHGAFKPP